MLKHMSRIVLLLLGILAVGVVSVSAQGQSIKTMQKDGLGEYLADSKGMTLYYFVKDTTGQSVCTGDCLTKWPPLLTVGETTVASGLNAKDFGALETPDGKQVTFRGYPLYRFFKDATPGDTNGQGVGGIWFVIDPQSFSPKQ